MYISQDSITTGARARFRLNSEAESQPGRERAHDKEQLFMNGNGIMVYTTDVDVYIVRWWAVVGKRQHTPVAIGDYGVGSHWQAFCGNTTAVCGNKIYS